MFDMELRVIYCITASMRGPMACVGELGGASLSCNFFRVCSWLKRVLIRFRLLFQSASRFRVARYEQISPNIRLFFFLCNIRIFVASPQTHARKVENHEKCDRRIFQGQPRFKSARAPNNIHSNAFIYRNRICRDSIQKAL